ncbi:MAG: hypothetical protein GQ537_04815, partial [Gammaproteobacteria bacterium]|nr:hypothetical protein [Gammaproteobacteria bacterium]
MLRKFTLLQLTETIIILIIVTHLLACGGGGGGSVGWTAPVMRSDGTPLPLADINGYR